MVWIPTVGVRPKLLLSRIRIFRGGAYRFSLGRGYEVCGSRNCNYDLSGRDASAIPPIPMTTEQNKIQLSYTVW